MSWVCCLLQLWVTSSDHSINTVYQKVGAQAIFKFYLCIFDTWIEPTQWLFMKTRHWLFPTSHRKISILYDKCIRKKIVVYRLQTTIDFLIHLSYKTGHFGGLHKIPWSSNSKINHFIWIIMINSHCKKIWT